MICTFCSFGKLLCEISRGYIGKIEFFKNLAGGVAFIQVFVEILLKFVIAFCLLFYFGSSFLFVDSVDFLFSSFEGGENGGDDENDISLENVLLEVEAVEKGKTGSELRADEVTPAQLLENVAVEDFCLNCWLQSGKISHACCDDSSGHCASPLNFSGRIKSNWGI